MTNRKIYRFKFSDDVTTLLADFSKLHQFDSKEQLKSCFEEFWEENLEVFQNDLNRLTLLGMDGGYDEYKLRVFRSMKYYHIKKIKKENGNLATKSRYIQEDEYLDKEKEKKGKNLRFSKILIEVIESSILKEMKVNPSFKPSIHMLYLFENSEFKIMIQEEQRRFRIIEQEKKDKSKITQATDVFPGDNIQDICEEEFISNFNSRLKKLYQNRYFNISSKVQ